MDIDIYRCLQKWESGSSDFEEILKCRDGDIVGKKSKFTDRMGEPKNPPPFRMKHNDRMVLKKTKGEMFCAVGFRAKIVDTFSDDRGLPHVVFYHGEPENFKALRGQTYKALEKAYGEDNVIKYDSDRNPHEVSELSMLQKVSLNTESDLYRRVSREKMKKSMGEKLIIRTKDQRTAALAAKTILSKRGEMSVSISRRNKGTEVSIRPGLAKNQPIEFGPLTKDKTVGATLRRLWPF